MPNKVIIDLFLRKLENSQTFSDEGSLPEEWRGINEYVLQQMTRNLDKFQQGHIDWRVLATYIVLLKSAIPVDKQIEEYKSAFKTKEDFVSEEAFLKVPAWFDESEYSKDRDYSIPFPRVRYIKELLFKIHR